MSNNSKKDLVYIISYKDAPAAFKEIIPEIKEKTKELNNLWSNLVNLLITIDVSFLFGSFVIMDHKETFPISWLILISWVLLLLAVGSMILGKIKDVCFRGKNLNTSQATLRQLLTSIKEKQDTVFSAPNFVIFSPILYSVLGFAFTILGICFFAAGVALPFLNKYIVYTFVLVSFFFVACELTKEMCAFYKSEKESKNN